MNPSRDSIKDGAKRGTGYKFLEEFQDQLYFATDICSPENAKQPIRVGLSAFLDEAMEQGKISYAAYEKISRGNALRLLGKV